MTTDIKMTEDIKDKKVGVSVWLEPDEYKLFLELKKDLGFKSSGQVLRTAIKTLSFKVQARKVQDEVEAHI